MTEKIKIPAKNIDVLILLAIKNSPEYYGLNISNWYNKHEILSNPPIGINKILKIVNKLEKNGLIQKSPILPFNYILTPLGKVEIGPMTRSMMNKIGMKEFYDLLSYFPEIEIKDRIENVENLIVFSFLTIIFYFLSKQSTNIYMIYVSSLGFFISSIQVISYFYTLIFLVSQNFLGVISIRLQEFFYKNKDLIFNVTVIISLIILIILANIVLRIDFKVIFFSLLLILIEKISRFLKIPKK